MMRKAAMYCDTRVVMTSQPAMTTRMVTKLFSSTKMSEMPSTPRAYWIWNRSTQGCSSVNCMPCALVSKPA